MSLDFSILEPNGLPGEDIVGLGVYDHHRLVSIFLVHPCPALSKLHDYYEDATFEPEEVSHAIAELSNVREAFRQDLFEKALHQNRGVIAIAD